VGFAASVSGAASATAAARASALVEVPTNQFWNMEMNSRTIGSWRTHELAKRISKLDAFMDVWVVVAVLAIPFVVGLAVGVQLQWGLLMGMTQRGHCNNRP
jgi:hypothetical protein